MDREISAEEDLRTVLRQGFVYRRKMGFITPVEKWTMKDGVVRSEIRERLLADKGGLREFFREDTLAG